MAPSLISVLRSIMSAPEFITRSLGCVAILGCSSVLIFWVEDMLTVTFGCLALKTTLSSLAHWSPRPPLKTTTLTALPSLTPNGLSLLLAVSPPLSDLLGSLPAQALSRPAAGTATRPAAAARCSNVRRLRSPDFSGVTDILSLLVVSGQAVRRRRPAYRDSRARLCSSPPGTLAER